LGISEFRSEEKSMRKRLVFAAFCILVLPLVFSPSQTNLPVTGGPFATTALAGHTMLDPGAIAARLDASATPEKTPVANRATPAGDNKEPSDQGISPIRAHSRSGFDFGTGTLLLALALFLWVRLRA